MENIYSLEAFEKSLAIEREERERENSAAVPNEQHRRRDRPRHEAGQSSRQRRECVDDDDDRRRHKRPRRDGNDDTHQRSRRDDGSDRRSKAHDSNHNGHYPNRHREGKDRSRHNRDNTRSQSPASTNRAEEQLDPFRKASVPKAGSSLLDEEAIPADAAADTGTPLVRDSWMVGPSAIGIDYVQSRNRRPQSHVGYLESPRPDADTSTLPSKDSVGEGDSADLAGQNEQVIDYKFGDEGSQWRMTKLNAVFAMAEETGRSVEQVAIHQYGNLKSFDDAREEKGELERRAIYGRGYVKKATPNGDLHRDRCREEDHAPPAFTCTMTPDQSAPEPGSQIDGPSEGTFQAMTMDPTALNRLRAKLMKAKLRGDGSAAILGAEYAQAVGGPNSVTARPPEPRLESGQQKVKVIGPMESRHLVGRRGEVQAADKRRARDRGQVVGNDDMTIEDMVREERKTRWQAGEESRGLAKRIATDGRFENQLEYMDENAEKLARRVHRSEINLRGMAVGEMQKMTRIMDNCPLCHDEDTGRRPAAPIVSLGIRVFLTLPPEPELGEFGAVLVPTAHRANLLECDDDEWEEIRNYMKSLTRMYHDLGREPVFYENAARQRGGAHATMQAVSIPYADGATAPAFFREALLEQAEEWSQHRKLIDTAARARDGLGRSAFRKTLAREMPYFHVWFSLDGGLGHVVENVDQWPRGDLFARQVLGGILDADPAVIHRQGRWPQRGPHVGLAQDQRVDGFRRRWRKFDWTRVLTEADGGTGGGS